MSLSAYYFETVPLILFVILKKEQMMAIMYLQA